MWNLSQIPQILISGGEWCYNYNYTDCMPSDQGYTDKNWQPKNKTSLMNVMVAINLKI